MSKQQEQNSSSDSPTTEGSTSAKSSLETQERNPNPTASSTGDDGDSNPPAEPETDQEPKNKEAARYRLRLREAEAERDALAAKFEAVTEHVVNQKLANVGMPLPLLRRMGVELGSAFAEDGSFSDTALLNIVNKTHEELGLTPNNALFKINRSYQQSGNVDWSHDNRSEVVPTAGTGGERPLTEADWSSVLQGK